MRRISSKNHDKEILKIVNNVIPECYEIYFRAGYFYYSGYSLIAKYLSTKPNIKLKNLVVNETDQSTYDLVNENYRRKKYFDKLSNEVLEKDILDNAKKKMRILFLKN